VGSRERHIVPVVKYCNLLIGFCAVAGCFATPATAQTESDIQLADSSESSSLDSLEKRNLELEKRVGQLERNQLENDVESYLDNVPAFASAQGDPSLTPGSQALRISGQLRWRGEVRDHLYSDDPDGEKSFGFVRQRARLRFDFDVIENIEVTVEIQDVRLWGDEQKTTGYLANVDLKRAFVLFKNLNGKPVDVQLGRQVLVYGDQRLVGHLEWVDQGRTYDGIRLKAHPEKFWLDAWAVNIRETGAANDDKYFYGVYGGNKWLDLYILGVQDQMTGNGEAGGTGKTFFATFGVRYHNKTGNFDYTVEIPFQFGDLNGDDLQAWAASATVGYTFEDSKWQPRIYFEFDYASGDDNPTDGKNKQFQTLFPTNHLWYGRADQVGWNNIMNFRLGVFFKPSAKWRVRIDYHHMMRPEELGAWQGVAGNVIRTGALGSSSHLADEVDVIVTWLPSKPVNVEFGWTTFFPGGFIKDTGESPTATFVWLQCRVVF